MEKFNPKAEWQYIKAFIKEAHPTVTDQDLAYVKGQEDEMLEILSIKTNRSKADLVRWINNLEPDKA